MDAMTPIGCETVGTPINPARLLHRKEDDAPD
jgi:hypothetical protein